MAYDELLPNDSLVIGIVGMYVFLGIVVMELVNQILVLRECFGCMMSCLWYHTPWDNSILSFFLKSDAVSVFICIFAAN
jgi:hypothetical protein